MNKLHEINSSQPMANIGYFDGEIFSKNSDILNK
jgi:hypothetical protein